MIPIFTIEDLLELELEDGRVYVIDLSGGPEDLDGGKFLVEAARRGRICVTYTLADAVRIAELFEGSKT